MRERRITTLIVAMLATAIATASAVVSASGAETTRPRWDTRVFSAVPSPGYPAHAYAHPNGRVYAGTYTNPQGDDARSRVFEWTRRGTLLRSWTVPGQDLGQPRGVQVATSDATGLLMLLEKGTARVLVLNTRTGRFTRYAGFRDLPTCPPSGGKDCSPNVTDKGAIPNFAAWGRRGELYVTDYGQAVIWRVPPGGGRPRIWLADRRLDGGEFGTAGLLMAPNHRALLVAQQTSAGFGEANPTSGKLYRVRIRDGKPRGMRTVWESRPGDLPDGFGIAESGRIYMSNAGLSNQLVVIGRDGEEVERFPSTPSTGENGSNVPFDTPSSATFLGQRLLVANQSFLGHREHHAILDVHVGERGVPVFIPERAGRR